MFKIISRTAGALLGAVMFPLKSFMINFSQFTKMVFLLLPGLIANEIQSIWKMLRGFPFPIRIGLTLFAQIGLIPLSLLTYAAVTYIIIPCITLYDVCRTCLLGITRGIRFGFSDVGRWLMSPDNDVSFSTLLRFERWQTGRQQEAIDFIIARDLQVYEDGRTARALSGMRAPSAIPAPSSRGQDGDSLFTAAQTASLQGTTNRPTDKKPLSHVPAPNSNLLDEQEIAWAEKNSPEFYNQYSALIKTWRGIDSQSDKDSTLLPSTPLDNSEPLILLIKQQADQASPSGWRTLLSESDCCLTTETELSTTRRYSAGDTHPQTRDSFLPLETNGPETRYVTMPYQGYASHPQINELARKMREQYNLASRLGQRPNLLLCKKMNM